MTTGRRLAVLWLVVSIVAACATGSPAQAAEELCPIMWTWVQDMGGAFNVMAKEATALTDPEARRTRYRSGFAEMRRLVEKLVDDVAALGDVVPGPVREDIENGAQRALGEIGDLERLLDEAPQVDEGRPQTRIAQLIVRVEKVIDLPKPEMASYGDPELLAAFRGVAACQHGVKDVDDGVPRAGS